MEITHVIRGEDHISNTPRQVLLYEALGFTPPVFAHLALVLGPDHTPLSKRHGATSVSEFRARGYLPEALVNYLALLGWSPGGGDELLPIAELARRFSLEHVGHSAAVFDQEKLAWANRHYVRLAEPDRLMDLAMPYFIRARLRGPATRRRRAPTCGVLLPMADRGGRSDRTDARAGAHGVRVRPGCGAGPAGGAGRNWRTRRRAPSWPRSRRNLPSAPRLDRESLPRGGRPREDGDRDRRASTSSTRFVWR